MNPIDQDISQRFRNGDPDALHAVVTCCQNTVFRIGLKLFANQDDAKDFCQDVFLHAFEKRGRYDPKRPLEPWLYRVALNFGRGRLRRKRSLSLIDADAFQHVDDRAVRDLVEEERRVAVQKALMQLKSNYRECLLLRFECDLKLEEIAGVLEIPLSTVKTRLRRAMAAFKECYIADGGDYADEL